jgi:uroporphyrinogen decarboxylase
MYLRGIKKILMDMVINPDIAKTIFNRIFNFYEEYSRRTLEAAEGNIDIFFTGDDFGTQRNMFISVDMWKVFLQDNFKKFINIGHKFNCKVAHHTCGSIVPLIPNFIESGLDILNPLQPDVVGMDHVKIKKEFGRYLTFHGAISIQKTLPFGTTEDVYSEVKDRVEQLASSGGYIFCTAHNIQSDTSLDNVKALIKAYRELGAY